MNYEVVSSLEIQKNDFQQEVSAETSLHGLSDTVCRYFKVPIAANCKDVCLQNTSKSHSYHVKTWRLL